MHLRDGLQPHSTVAQRYAHLVETGEIADDPAQRPVVAALDRLNDEIRTKRLQRKSSALGWLFAKNTAAPELVTGLYIHGGVGCGKTMLMDLFFETVPVRRKRRVHFNAFMADAHDRIQKHRLARKNGTTKEDDPIPPVARALAEEAWVLCFDEFSVTDIADAMILSRLFSALFANGVVLVATSNVAPDDLYRDGLNRQLFLPFIGLLKRHTEVIALDSATDYRMEKLNRMPVYLTPLSAETDRLMERGLGGGDAWHAGRAGCADGQGPAGAGAAGGWRCRALQLRRPLRRPARGERLSCDRRAIFDDLCRPYSGARPDAPQSGEAFHPADRYALRQPFTPVRQCGGPAAGTLPGPPRRHGSLRVRPHRLAAHRNAEPGMAGRLGGRRGKHGCAAS